jgi:hypothetical protein
VDFSNNFDLGVQKDKFMINQLLNSTLKRTILGLFFKLNNEFIQNTTWNPDIYKKLIKIAGSKEKVKKEFIEKHFDFEKDNSSFELFIELKIITSISPDSKSIPQSSTVVDFFDQNEEFQVITGIKFANDRFSTPSGGLELSLGAIQTLIEKNFKRKVAIAKLRKVVSELHGIPSRHSPGEMYFLISPTSESVAKTSAIKKAFYHMNDPLYVFLNAYHPVKGKIDSSGNGSIFLDLFSISLKLERFISKTDDIQKQAKEYLKQLDKSLILKSIINLVETIIKRELIIADFKTILDESRFSTFKEKLESIANDGKLGYLMIKEADMTNHPLPEVFEFIDPYEQALGVVDDWLTAFSRVMTSFIVSRTINLILKSDDFSFQIKIGDIFFIKLYEWLQSIRYRQQINQIDELLTEAEFLVEFYSKNEIETITNAFKKE